MVAMVNPIYSLIRVLLWKMRSLLVSGHIFLMNMNIVGFVSFIGMIPMVTGYSIRRIRFRSLTNLKYIIPWTNLGGDISLWT